MITQLHSIVQASKQSGLETSCLRHISLLHKSWAQIHFLVDLALSLKKNQEFIDVFRDKKGCTVSWDVKTTVSDCFKKVGFYLNNRDNFFCFFLKICLKHIFCFWRDFYSLLIGCENYGLFNNLGFINSGYSLYRLFSFFSYY